MAIRAGVFYAEVLSKEIHGLVADMSLRDRSGLACPLDGGGCADVGLLLIGRKACKTAQEIFCVAQSEADCASRGKVGFNGLDHRFTSGHG